MGGGEGGAVDNRAAGWSDMACDIRDEDIVDNWGVAGGDNEDEDGLDGNVDIGDGKLGRIEAEGNDE